MRLHGKSQSALEYVMIVAITLAILVPTTYLFFSYSATSNNQINNAQLLHAGHAIIDAIDTIYYSGRDSKMVIEVQFPETVYSMFIIDNRELVFNVTSKYGEQELVFFSDNNITSETCVSNICYFTGVEGFGTEEFRIQSINNGNQVLISRT